MNEERIQSAMAAYSESLGNCRTPERTYQRRPRLLLASVVAVGVCIGIGALWPRDAVAGSVKRIGAAIKNAQTMEVVSLMRSGDRPWHQYSQLHYKQGMWRHRTRQGSNLDCTYVLRDERVLTEYLKLDHATLEKMDPSYHEILGDDVSAIDYVMQSIDQGHVGIERATAIEPGPIVNGRPTYKVVLTREADDYRADIVVDKATDLPIWSSTTIAHSPRQISFFRQEYQFNKPLPDSLFSLSSTKPTVDVEAAQAKLADHWRKPIASTDQVQIRDASITRDGTIWIVSTSTAEKPPVLPTTLNTVSGQTYIRMRDITPSAVLGKQNIFKLNGQRLYVVGFLPLDLKQPRPTRVTIDLSRRGAAYPNYSEPQMEEEPMNAPIDLDLRAEQGTDRPGYFTSLDLDHFGFQLNVIVWDTRAVAFEKEGNLLEAARAYEQTAVAYRSFVRSVGSKPLRQAARCYRELGLVAEAEAREKEATALQEGRAS